MFASWLLCLALFTLADEPVISEFMAANDHTLADEDGDYSDWLELHNPGAVDLDLSGCFLTDDEDELDRWPLPSATTLPAGGFLVVFASGKDRTGSELHSDFKLKSGGEYLALVAPDGVTLIHDYAPEYPAQLDDVSYGLAFDAGGASDTETYFPEPTPGAANGAGGPAILEVLHHPERPDKDDVITVTAQVLPVPGASLHSVTMTWRAMFGAEQLETMYDDGQGGDAQAGDGVYTAQIPPRQVKRGRMIRWFVGALDVDGSQSRSPPFLDPLDSPEYHGTILDDPRFAGSQLPMIHWFAADHDGADSRTGTRGAAFHDGRFYDNVFIRIRGGSSASWQKHSYKIEFNRGHDLVWSAPEWGVDERRTDEVNLNTTWSDKAFVRQSMGFEVMRDTGVTGSASFPVRMQRNGLFWSVAIWIEQVDGDCMERNGLDPEGALYKMYNQTTSAYSGVEKKTRLYEDNSDLARLVAKVNRQNDNVVEKYLFDEVDLPAMVNYLAATAVIHETDHVHKNHYLWRDSDGDGEWRFLPWDKDLSFGRNYIPGQGVLNDTIYADDDPWSHPLLGDESHPNPDGFWNRFIDACHRVPRVREMYLRRLRTMMDTLLQDPSTPPGELRFEQRIEQLYGQLLNDTELDEARWGIPSWGTRSMDFREGLDQLLDEYLAVRRVHLFKTHSGAGQMIPALQGHPHLRIGAVERHPRSGDPLEQYVVIENPNDTAVDLSGWRLQGGVSFDLPLGSVVPAQDVLHLSPHLPSFRDRSRAPKGGQRLLVLGPWIGTLFDNDPLFLVDGDGVVVATDDRPWLSLRDVEAGKRGSFSLVGLEPGRFGTVLASLSGPGPTDTRYGPMDLSMPIHRLGAARADAAGTVELQFDVPPVASGVTMWFQGFDVGTESFTNGVEWIFP